MASKSFLQITNLNSKRLLIVDTLNLAFRFKHAKATDFLDAYMSTVKSFAQSFNCGKIILVGDKGSSSYRKAIYPQYKANRAEKYETQTEAEAEEFLAFLQEVSGILEAYEEVTDIPVLRFKGVEADDLGAYIVKVMGEYDVEFIQLLSSDRDWDLLVNPAVSRFSYVTKKEITLDNWSEHYDYAQEDHISIKCLQGDSGDNVDGVPGVGPKKAYDLVKQYGTAYDIAASLPISSKYKYIANLNTFGKDNILLNYQLMDLLEFCEEAIGPENIKTVDNVLTNYLGKK